jgi:AcrR family transcriptional regulator
VSASTPKTPRRAAIEASVLAATEELLREGSSYADLGVEKIATRAGISRTAFYFYFRDKRELLMRVTAGVSDTLFDAADRWWSGEGSGEAELREAIGSILTLYDEHAALLAAVVEASTYDEEIAGFWRDLIGRFVAATRARIVAEQEAGRVPADLPAEGVAFSLCWMTERAAYEHVVQRRGATADELVSALVAVWVRAVYGES